MYSLVLERLLVYLSGPVKDKIANDFREILSPIIVLASPLPMESLSCLLKMDITDIRSRLLQLHSVLDIPTDPKAPVRPLHLSFREFLVSPDKRADNFWVDEKETHKKLATRCLELLGDRLKEDFCNPKTPLQKPGMLRKDISPQIIEQYLPPEVQYACQYWIYHLKESKGEQDEDKIYQFLKSHFLHWLEALSLIGKMSGSNGLIGTLQSLVAVSNVRAGI
jgi:hypothetical protein